MANPGTARAYGLNRSESGEPLRWARDAVAFRLHPDLEAAMPEGQAYAAVTMAFDAWRGLPRVPDLLLVSGMPDAPGHHDKGPTNGIYLVRDWQNEPDQLAITVVTYSKSTGRVLDADILVNANADIELLDETEPSEAPRYDLGAILAHEAGHSLGLDESETVPEATMWPRVSPGETHQRTLSHDDEEGAIANYAGQIPELATGCGQASVLGRPSGRGPALLLGLAMLLLGLGLARSALRRGLPRRTMAFGLGTLLVAVPGTGEDAAQDEEQKLVAQLAELDSSADQHAKALLARAAHDERESVRLGAALTLERLGAPEQRELAAHLALDESPSVAQTARRALPRLLARVPAQWQSESEPAARARIARVFGPDASMRALVRGQASTRGAAWQDGFIVTEHVVRDASGDEHTLARRGGSIGDVSQRLLHTEAGPVDGAEVIVEAGERGAKRWAYHHDGYVFGGSLGEGPAIRLAR